MAVPTQHVLSFSRVVAGAYVWSAIRVPGDTSVLVLPVVLLACWSDFADGRLARANETASHGGRLIDNLCDGAFLALSFTAFARAEVWSDPVTGSAVRYWDQANWLPLIALGLSFGIYMLRWWLSVRIGAVLAPSLRGHSAGVFNYVLAVVGAVAVLPGFELTRWIVEPAFVTVVLLNATAVSENVLLIGTMFRSR